MLTKTLRFDDDVLKTIRAMQWSEDGLTGKITEQLDRGLYERVNKALAAMGGTWNRKAGGHVFPTDPRGAVEGLVESGELIVDKDDFFETQRVVTEMMIKEIGLPADSDVLEPSAGMGAIARVLRAHGIPADQMRLIEINEARAQALRKDGFYTECRDFLTYKIKGWTRIFMNPPFSRGQDIDHVMHAYNLLAEGGAMASVMSEGVFFREDARSVLFRDWLKKVKGKAIKLPEKSFHESGTDVRTRLVIIHKPAP
jgi:hypothetical protein